MNDFHAQLKSDASAVTAHLSNLLSDTPMPGEIHRPEKLLSAMRHGVLNGGKRLRPFLVLQSGRLFGAKPQNLLQIAAALECVHCYSLIHDDLPAMDDDDLRRGQPTVHIAFDEAVAILAGDALLTFAFDCLANRHAHDDASIRISLVSKLARSAGLGGMVGGQILDITPSATQPSPDDILQMQAMKTGALLKFACISGAICGGASARELAALTHYGQCIGKAFQLADDILDITATTTQLGKNTAKDQKKGKQTQVSNIGISAAQKLADQLADEACDALTIFDDSAQLLRDAARFAVNRDH